jgi:hypothetical protein
MRNPGSMVDPSFAVAVVLTPTQLGIERVEHVSVQRAELDASDQREDVPIYVGLVSRACARADPKQGQVPFHELFDCRLRAGIPPLVDLTYKPRPNLLGLASCPSARRGRPR